MKEESQFTRSGKATQRIFRFEMIPDELKQLPRWVLFKIKGKKKIPISQRDLETPADCSNPATWGSFNQCVDHFMTGACDAIAFSLCPPYVGIDLDGCYEGGDLTSSARDIVETADSYTETSIGLTGVHILLKGQLKKAIRTRGFEVYQTGRFFIFTGYHYPGTPLEILERQAYIDSLPQSRVATDGDGHNGAKVAAGERNIRLISLAGSMQRRGMAKTAIEAALLVENIEHCDPPLDDAEVRKIATSIGRYPPDPSFVVDNEARTYAHFLTTDLSNADRIMRFFGRDLLFSGGRWHFWNGSYWSMNEAEARKNFFNLSELILGEAKDYKARAEAVAKEEEKKAYLVMAEELQKWAAKSESLLRIDAAFKIVKDMVAVPQDKINADPWLLNVRNGTVELRTGELQPHKRKDYINRIIDIDYHPGAKADRFRQFVEEIMGEAGSQYAPMAGFLQRWFGYCATGLTKEHKFSVHHGDGGNGKSTLLDVIAAVLGSYAGTAAPHLLVSGAADRHPTEVADLWGKRMITAHESGESGVLREEFIKQATGGDRLKGRFMRQDFFEFLPTHKIQLCTNYKPTVRGTDFGIWRRVMLIPYMVTFGTEEEVQKGDAGEVKDPTLLDQLLEERKGILAWIVQGAASWHKQGLNPPDPVAIASAAYREEQDKISQFIREECMAGSDHWTPLNFPVVDNYGVKRIVGLYPAYVEWSKASGYHQLGKGRFQEALEKKAKGRWLTKYLLGASGKRRRTVVFEGLGLIEASPFSEAVD